MPNNFWDDFLAPDSSEQPSFSDPDHSGFWDEILGVDTSAPVYRGLPQDEWTPEDQKSTGWGDITSLTPDSLGWRDLAGPGGRLLFGNDNPINRGVGQAVSLATSVGTKIASFGADLFQTAIEEDKKIWNNRTADLMPQEAPAAAVLNSMSVGGDFAIPSNADYANERVDALSQASPLRVVRDVGREASAFLDETTQSLTTKKDFGGGFWDEIKGDVASGQIVEAITDTAGMMVDTSAQMAGMALAGGPVAGVGGLNALSSGMALSVYGDTYADLTKNEDDSRVLAALTAGTNAAVQGKLEQIGWDVMVGKTVFGEWFKTKATDSLKKTVAARMILSSPTEGFEEGGQGLSDILARNLPNVQRDGWDKVLLNIGKEASEQLPEQAFAGAVFGGVFGGGVATMQKLGAKDVVARNARTPNTPEQQIANSVNSPASDEKAKGALLNVIETVSGGDLTGVFDKNNDGVMDGPVGPADPVDTLYQAAKNANASMDAVDEAIKDIVQNEEKERAGLAEGLTTTDIEATANRIQASIEKMGQERGQRANAVVAVAQNMLQMAAGGQAAFDAEDTEQAGPQRTQMAVTPQEVAGAIQMQAAEMGLEVPKEALANPSAFDWQGWTQQEVEKGREEARNGLSEPLQAVREAIEVEADSTMASVLASVPEAPAQPMPMVVGADSVMPITDDRSGSDRILEATRTAAAKAGARPYQAKIHPSLMATKGNSAETLRDGLWVKGGSLWARKGAKNTIEMPQEMEMFLESMSDPDNVAEEIRLQMPDVSESKLKSTGVIALVNQYALLSNDLLSNKHNPEKAAKITENMLGVVKAIESNLADQRIPGITTMPDLVVQIPDIEANNRVTQNLHFDKRESSGFITGARSMGRWLLDEVVPELASTSQQPDKLRTAARFFVEQEESAFQIAPQIKNIVFNVWQTGSKGLVERLGEALRTGQSAMPEELAIEVADHLASQGYYVDLPTILQNDPQALQKFSHGLTNVGKGVMSPWAMERIMLDVGFTPVVAKSSLAAMNAMAERWAMKNGKDVFEWWDRLGDHAKVVKFLSSRTNGSAAGAWDPDNNSLSGVDGALEYGRGILRLFSTKDGSAKPSTILHEMIHLLYFSNLLYEMLDEEGRAAMEELAGVKLWTKEGRPITSVSTTAQERMAMGLEIFVFENRAPNARLKDAFTAVKEFYRNHIHKWMDLLNVNITGNDERFSSEDVPIYGSKGKGVYLEMKDIHLHGAQIRMFYQLLNSEPDGTEIVYNSPGISGAMETLLTKSTGIPADGVFTSGTDMASVITLPVFPNGRVVTADDLPDAVDAANTKWFHGTDKMSLHHVGLESVGGTGLVGTGVYLTDDPKVANSYRVLKTGDEEYWTKDSGEIYAVKVSPRKVINLEVTLPEDVKKILTKTFGEYLEDGEIEGKTGIEILDVIKQALTYEYLQRYEVDDMFTSVEADLREAGYDAYTHIGGAATKSKLQHRVLVLLDPSSMQDSSYPKTKMEMWPTAQIDPETVEDDWDLHSGHAPSDSQWRRIVGLTNSESNGTHTHATLLAMEKEREYLAGLAKDVVDRASESTPEPPSKKAKVKAQKELLKAVSDGEVLKGEALSDAMMDQLLKQVSSSGKDAYGSGDVIDPTNMEQVKDMLSNFMSKMRSWGYLIGQGKMDQAMKDILKSTKYGVAKTLITAAKKYENSFGSESADFERELEKLADISKEERERLMVTGGQAAVDNRIAEVASLNMGALAKVMNNHYALGKLADKVAEKIPSLWDPKLNKWVQIAGARSYMQITTTFNQMADAYYAANSTKLPYSDGYEFHEAATRDLRMWMYSQRQFELIQNVADDTAKWEEAKRQWNLDVANALAEGREHDVPEPPKPKMPKITEEGTKWAESVKMLMELRYGKNLAMFKATAQELTQWENHMVLDKLHSVKMITDKEHADMLRKGKHHIPMYKIRDAIARSGAVNPRLDDSVYKPLDYLKNDISHKSEDPLNAMLRRAAGIEMLTMRQHAKNTIGQRILTDVKWWASDYADSPFQILSFKEEITKKEFDEIAKSGEFVVTSTVRHKKDDQGNRKESGHTYYKHVPFRAEHIEAGLKQITNKAAMRGFNKEANKEADAERARFEQTIFAFYPEPGKPMYVVISDPSLAKAFFRMNNSQAAWQDSLAGKIMTGIDSMQGSNINAEVSEKLAYKLVRGTATGLYGFNKFAKSAITSNLSFLYNAIFRDMTAVIRSRAGLRWRDIPTAVGDASALLFPSLMEIYPERFQAARDASEGMATFSGLAATNLRGDLDAEVLFSLTRGRGDLLQKAKHGSYTAISKLMWNDMKQFFAKEGLTTAPGQMVSELKRGKNKRKHLISIAKSPITMGIAAGQFVGTVMENTTRLAERRLMMAEDMSKYPTLASHYNNDLAINGKLLAGFTGTMHRMRWERAKKMLAKDPNYKVPEDSLPVQTNMTERDYAMNHITLNFAQRGRHTATMDQHLMFFNPMAQDFYTNIMILARHSALQKAVASALGNDWKAAKDQVRLDAAAHAWLVKSFFYITIPAIAMIAMYGGDDDDSKEWQAQSMIEKLSYNWLPTDKMGLTDEPIRVAQGLGLYSLLFKDMPMAFFLDAAEKDPKAWSKYWDRFFDSTPMGVAINPLREYEDGGFKGMALAAAGGLPSPLALEALDPMVELLADKEKYRNKAIAFPQALAREDPTEVQRERHNMFVNAVTKAFSGSKLQPAQVKYLIGRYTPGSSKWIPTVINKAMETVAGVEGMPEDVQPSNSPIAGQSPGWLPRWQAKEAWGMGNEFVQDLLSTARDASEKMRSYEQMPEARKPVYLAANPLIHPDIYYGVKPVDGFRSGGLEYAAKWVIQQDKDKKEALKAGRINETEAMLIERQYTMFAMEAMRNVVFQLGE